ncbi:polysaccharide pyruvyl transferase family protein [Haloarcula onubensis]|uniref:Polysaccharide pyruvyl transferase family protein n=1 Tax=Haloarcula onubensis TaxID=2950539 RepID=A0ABU2FLF5_9EURY|nr:polysaccharide pyruvyl transferase family protein [Halomicroarcula sp. S3CR25-11]MDS0281583.1 polysaccharide pyruvyl transferase family protein [Halomicroarcula sp. S3CR25-11]
MDLDSLTLAYAYGCRNAGDFAINEGSLALLDRTVPDVDVTAVSRFASESPEYERMVEELDGVEDGALVGGPITYDPESQSRPAQLAALARNGLQYGVDVAGVADDLSVHSALYEGITDADAMLFNGGNAIHYSPSHGNLPYLLAMLYPLQVARRNDVPYGLLPQTTFALEGVARRLVVPLLEDAEFVMTRDAITFDYLSEFGLSTQLINGVDTAFLNGTPTAGDPSDGESNRIAAVPRFSTLGDTGELDAAGKRMEDTFLTYLDRLVDAGDEVTLTIQTEIDAAWAERNRDRLDDIGVGYYESYDPDELRAHYAEMDLLVTMRLHAAIFALSVGTPTIGVYRPEWGPKMDGTFRTLDIAEYAIPWDGATVETLEAATADALDEGRALSQHVADNVSLRNEALVSDLRTALSTADGFA